jgi:hypothetical protein
MTERFPMGIDPIAVAITMQLAKQQKAQKAQEAEPAPPTTVHPPAGITTVAPLGKR